jgi:hypothetical protein
VSLDRGIVALGTRRAAWGIQDQGVTAGGAFEVIDFMEQRPALVAELLRVHVDDGTGHCAGCSWRQAAVPIHPCGIRWYAECAEEALRCR